MDQDTTWCEGIGLGPGHIVIDGNPAPLPQKGAQRPYPKKRNSAHVYCPNGWMIKMPLGMEVSLDSSNIVLDGDAVPLPKRGQSPQF